MKTILSLIIILISVTAMSQNQYKHEWQQIDSLAGIGQSQSALNMVTALYDESKINNQADQFLKAILYRLKLEADYQEDYYEKSISRLQSEAQSAQAPVKQILHSILAEVYWTYYQNNRWQILGRSETSNFVADDIKTWDLKKLVSACMLNYSLSLTDKDLLKNTSLVAYNEILIKQKDSEKFRPTLFDFLAFRAINFYSLSEAGLTKPATTFLMDKPEFFSSSAGFSSLNIVSPDTFSFEFQAIKLYKEVIGVHLSDKDPTALIDAEMDRLSFVHQKCILPEKDSLYLDALYKLENRFKNLPSSTEVVYQIASQLSNDNEQAIPYLEKSGSDKTASYGHKWDKKKAIEICESAMERFPDSFGAENCRSLIENIKQPALAITNGYAAIPAKPSLALVTYKNVKKIYIRLLKMNPETVRELQEKQQEYRLQKYLDTKILNAWEQVLPDDGDYSNHSAEIKIPALLPGFYVMLASSDATFPAKSAIVTSNNFWVTSISYLSRNTNNENNEIVVLHRESGQPLAKVKVQAFYREYNSNFRKYENNAGAVFVTDKAGMVNISSNNESRRNNQFYLVFSTKGDQLITDSYFSNYSYPTDDSRVVLQTRFFTDRAIYRPGQPIYYKGIVLEQKGGDVKIKTNYKSEITLYDVNGQVVSKQSLTTNEFGSYSGNFIAPQGVLTGQMNIRSETGSVSVQVEEYKRPKFEVAFEPVKGSYKLGETIVAKGKATAYAGSTVPDANVRYRVVRQAHFPNYWWGWRGMPTSNEMEITNGETVTDNAGTFTISFKAIPDLSVDRKTEPVFNYTVYADVTDINGESHNSETAISVGYKALLVKTDLADDINLEKGIQFTLTTTNLNGEKEKASGTISISKLRKPDDVLFTRKWTRPDKFTMTKADFIKDFPGEVYDNEDDITTWQKETTIFTTEFTTPTDSLFKLGHAMPSGMYIIEIITVDAFGQPVLYTKYFNAFQSQSGNSETVSPAFLTLLTSTVEPGEDARFIIGTPLKKAYIIYEIVHKDKIVSRKIISLTKEQNLISIPVKEEYRGNFGITLSFVKNNRSFLISKIIEVPYTNKKLDITFATFRDKLLPGQNEEWQITLHDSKGEKAVAEMLAGMYDASLDIFTPHNWIFNIFSSNFNLIPWNDNRGFSTETGNQFYYPETTHFFTSHEYDQLNWYGFGNGYYGGMKRPMMKAGGVLMMEDRAMPTAINEQVMGNPENETGYTKSELLTDATTEKTPKVPKENVPQSNQIRTNFNETAFFFPQLATNQNGEIVIKFKAPEALTRWKMMGLAYTKDLKYGQIEKTLVTQKDLMLFPNAPRFLREGDKMDFAAKISNISDRNLSGIAELHFFDALTMKPVDDILGLTKSSIPFTVNKGLSSPISWKISIPEGLQAIIYRITASAGAFSDGEEAAIPVLTNRMLVTECMPLPVNGLQSKKFSFEKLINSRDAGSTLRNYRLSLEYTSNPAWYAVQALPYLMEYPYECTEQIFSRYYANSLATHIANSDPKIKRVFESWKTITPNALKSNLEKNEELKSVLLQESPWVREATNESERKHRIALLFDLNRMVSEQSFAFKKLRDMQNPNGGWAWFQGMPESRYITQHIVSGIGHLYYLDVLNPVENSEIGGMLQKAIDYLDQSLKINFEKIKNTDKDYQKNNHLGYDDIQYLYARTYFMADFPISKDYNEMLEYYKSQSVKYWMTQNNYMKAMISLYLNRFGNENTASLIIRSLKETALHNEEMGMYWRNEQRGWNWYQAPVETQALLIEAFGEVSNDQKSVEEMKIWLLKQKQTQDWKTTKATTEAIYALLLKGTSLLASDKQVEITLGTEKVDPYKQDGTKPEAGTGYFKTSWDAAAIKPDMGKVTVNNPNPTVAWGALYWQYFEQLDKITPAQTPLSLAKKLFIEVNTPTGPVIEPITEKSQVKVGDKIVVRVELRADRDMEYIHLKDMRASAFEPVNVLSGYRYQDGLGYYESTRDASTNFFIYYLPKGTFVFEYRLVATQKGDFSNGITSVQCMYAPEFSAHSEGVRVKVE